MIDRNSLSDQVRDELRHRIMCGELSLGSRVDVERIAAELSVSLSPVKEALRQLAHDGIVEIRPRSGTFIRTFRRRDVEEIYDCRRMIEPAAAAKVAESGGSPELRRHLGASINRLKAASEGDTFVRPFDVIAADSEFHRDIVAASGNRVLVELHDVLIDRALVVRTFASSGVRAGETLDEHREILAAIIASDPDTAASASIRHLNGAEGFILSSMPENG